MDGELELFGKQLLEQMQTNTLRAQTKVKDDLTKMVTEICHEAMQGFDLFMHGHVIMFDYDWVNVWVRRVEVLGIVDEVEKLLDMCDVQSAVHCILLSMWRVSEFAMKERVDTSNEEKGECKQKLTDIVKVEARVERETDVRCFISVKVEVDILEFVKRFDVDALADNVRQKVANDFASWAREFDPTKARPLDGEDGHVSKKKRS